MRSRWNELPVTAFAGSMAAAKRQVVDVMFVACSDSPADVTGLTAAPIGEPFLERQANALGRLRGAERFFWFYDR